MSLRPHLPSQDWGRRPLPAKPGLPMSLSMGYYLTISVLPSYLLPKVWLWTPVFLPEVALAP